MAEHKLNVLVNGMGNIGVTLTNLLVRYKKELCLQTIYVAKRSIHEWNLAERKTLTAKGVIICTMDEQSNYPSFHTIIQQVDYIFEATANGVGLANLKTYQSLPQLKGACAQGSEKQFGVPFMTGVNNKAVIGQKFVNVVSCNTHGTAAILQTFCGETLSNLAGADVVVVRRSEDLGNHQRLVSANVVARHLNDKIGTHHAIDVVDLFKTINVDCALTSSDITTPSQLLHAVRFNITLNHPLQQTAQQLIGASPFMASTQKFDSNVIFELGRRYGFQGRLFAHGIVLTNNLLQTNTTVKGWAFVPQEGNSLLSTIHAYLLQVFGETKKAVFAQITNDLMQGEW